MKKVIGGKLYDTETAEKLHSVERECRTSIFFRKEDPSKEPYNEYADILYLTKKGKYFLYNEQLHFPEDTPDNPDAEEYDEWSITPLTDEEAFNWLQGADADGHVILKYFPNVEAA